MISLFSFLILFLGGIATGTLGALLGIGGGVFLIPFLVLVIGVPMHQAIATSIVAVIATSSAGAAMNVERHTVNIRLGMLLEVATVSGAIFGGFTAILLSGDALRKIFAAMLLAIGGLMLYRLLAKRSERVAEIADGALHSTYLDESTGSIIPYSVRRVPFTMLVSLIAGNISGLLGVGGGIFKVPAMNLVSGVPIKVASATSNFMIGVTAAASVFIYFSHGHLNGLIASSATLGVLAGSFLGVHLYRRIHGNALTWIFAILMLVVAIEMFLV